MNFRKKNIKMATNIKHTLLDETVFDNMLLCKGITPDQIQRVPDIDLDGDTVVVSYPKTG